MNKQRNAEPASPGMDGRVRAWWVWKQLLGQSSPCAGRPWWPCSVAQRMRYRLLPRGSGRDRLRSPLHPQTPPTPLVSSATAPLSPLTLGGDVVRVMHQQLHIILYRGGGSSRGTDPTASCRGNSPARPATGRSQEGTGPLLAAPALSHHCRLPGLLDR